MSQIIHTIITAGDGSRYQHPAMADTLAPTPPALEATGRSKLGAQKHFRGIPTSSWAAPPSVCVRGGGGAVYCIVCILWTGTRVGLWGSEVRWWLAARQAELWECGAVQRVRLRVQLLLQAGWPWV